MPVREALEGPPLPGAHLRLGQIREKKGDPAGARTEYETALSMDSKEKLARDALGETEALTEINARRRAALPQNKSPCRISPAGAPFSCQPRLFAEQGDLTRQPV